MKKKPIDLESLRKKAEQKLRKQEGRLKDLSALDIKRLVHELGTYQIELEMQNEELRMAQTELEESRGRYADLYDFAPIGYFTFDKNGLILELNLSGANLLGMDKRFLSGKPMSPFIIPNDRNTFTGHIAEVLSRQVLQTCDIQLRRKDKSVFHVRMQSIAVEDEQGRLTLCRSAMSDVTEQKKSGAAIAQLASFPNVNPNPIFELNPSGEITYVNPAASKIFPDLAVKGINHPLCAGHSMLREMFKAGEKVAHTREIKIGNEWFEQAIYYVREGSLIRAYNQNITERKQAETDMLESRQLNELLLDSIPHPTMLIRRDRTILAANKIAREAGAAVGEFCWQSFGHSEFIPEEAKLYFKGHNRDFSSSCIKCSFCIADETKESSNPAHCEVKAFGRLWDTWWVPVKDDIYLHYAIDITERKLAEEELRKHREHLMELVEERTSELNRINITLEQEIAERKLAEAETIRAGHLAALGELAAGVAHEINNPVNGIINFAQILLNKSEPESKDREFADRIIKEGLRIATIVKNLLSFARDRKEEKRPVHVQSIMTETLALTELYLKKEGINLRVNIPSDLPEIIAHPQQIQQVVLNIISNARYALNQKFDGSHKNKTLEISGEKISVNDNAYLRMTFHDNGIGIPPDVIDKALNPFFSTKPDEKGTGLGLSISHGIITDHGGRIALESVEGEFTKVIIDLPVKK